MLTHQMYWYIEGVGGSDARVDESDVCVDESGVLRFRCVDQSDILADQNWVSCTVAF